MSSTQAAEKPSWKDEYGSQLETPESAVSNLRPGQRVFLGAGCGQPLRLLQAMVARSKDLVDIEIIDFLTLADVPYANPELAHKFRINSFFIGEGVRDTLQQGYGDYTPIFLSDIPRLFSSGKLPLDVAMIQVSPPDERGRCSLGVAVDIAKSAAENAGLVIAQINEHMPRTHGDSYIHIHNLDIIVAHNEPLIEVPPAQATDVTKTIGEYIAALVENGSTIEFGIGAIPQAVAAFLKNKQNLGIHTEMFTDSVIDLIEAGAIDGSRKSMDKGKVVASFCMGTRKLYDYIDDNPGFAFYPTEHVNDPFIISRQNKMVAINVAMEVDLTGQVCADSVGTQFYSGIGGQVDFNRGAAKSPGGKAIIALHSTAKDDTISRIKTTLSPGSGVVTSRGDVHYVVTEYGVAYLHGKSVQERAVALISIAHPKFRGHLLKEAIQAGFLPGDFADTETGFVVGLRNYHATQVLNDATLVTFRSMYPTDEPAVRDLFYKLSQQTIYYRFMSRMKNLPRRQIKDLVYINHRTDVAVVATVPEAHGDQIIAVGRYYLDQTTNRAEVAFIVQDDWQNKGVGTMLLDELTKIAKRNGIKGFTAEVLRENRSMQQVLNKSDCNISCTPDDNALSYKLDFKS
ncbi:MAG: GNAT family N-acetyltransferase [Chitinivibrionales bacterium]|nr:GNAT family N-acetyltransferase [Chitinivibrionales bacterium]